MSLQQKYFQSKVINNWAFHSLGMFANQLCYIKSGEFIFSPDNKLEIRTKKISGKFLKIE